MHITQTFGNNCMHKSSVADTKVFIRNRKDKSILYMLYYQMCGQELSSDVGIRQVAAAAAALVQSLAKPGSS
jgi:hypothetical protein